MITLDPTTEVLRILLGPKLSEALRRELRLLEDEWGDASHARRCEIAHQAAIINELLAEDDNG
jgi:hypothetical protein